MISSAMHSAMHVAPKIMWKRFQSQAREGRIAIPSYVSRSFLKRRKKDEKKLKRRKVAAL